MKHFAVENLSENADPVVDPVNLDEEAALIAADRREIDSTQSEIEEVESIGEYLEGAVERVEKAEEAGGLSGESATEIRAAVEHFQRRLNLSKPIVASVESFRSDKLSSTRQTKAELVALQTSLNKELQMVQEGLVSRIGNAIRRCFTSYKEVIAKLQALQSSAANAKEKEFKDPAWGRIFASTGKRDISGKDILDLYGDLAKKREKILPTIERAVKLISDAARAANASFIVAKKKYIDEIEAMQEELSDLAEKMKAEYFSYEKEKVSIQAIPAEMQKKIVDTVLSGSNNGAVNKKLERLYEVLFGADMSVRAYSDGGATSTLQVIVNAALDVADESPRVFRKVCNAAIGAAEKLLGEYTYAEYYISYAVMRLVQSTTK